MNEKDIEIEKLKYEILDYLIRNDLYGAINYIRSVAPLIGLKGAKSFVDQVRKELLL